MDTKYNEQKNNENQSRKPYSGAANLFMTLIRKNRDTVEVELSNGSVLSGYIDAFDDQGVIVGLKKNGQDKIGEVYVTRQQIVTITPINPLCYLDKEKSSW